ncbi:hypothetical protein BV25DRAFT_291759 [Artomyces pyxidatus]|uniref:Uncharacterized protein n=1 Tax=Artomyces pyxidatus TaxID=48021 RepID=A0ACB8SFW1_9AGAM|nr:hypothetical protein BV25DRAFT_291759 [Artomyces pyxidatus]
MASLTSHHPPIIVHPLCSTSRIVVSQIVSCDSRILYLSSWAPRSLPLHLAPLTSSFATVALSMAYRSFLANLPSDFSPFRATAVDDLYPNPMSWRDTEHPLRHCFHWVHMHDDNNQAAPAGEYYSTFETPAPSNAQLYAPIPRVAQGAAFSAMAFNSGPFTIPEAQFDTPVRPPAGQTRSPAAAHPQSQARGAPLGRPTSSQSVTEVPAPHMLFQQPAPALSAAHDQPMDGSSVSRIIALLGIKAVRSLFHPDPRPAAIACSWPGCAQGVAPDAHALYEHFVAAHCGQQSSVDCTCGRTLKLGSLRKHLKTPRHLGPWLVGRCALCGAAVARDDAMGAHLLTCPVMRDPARRAAMFARFGLRMLQLEKAGQGTSGEVRA